MTLKVRSNIIIMTLREGGRGLLKPSECHHMDEGGWRNRHITFILAEKA